MQIQTLKVFFTEEDAVSLAAKYLPAEAPVKKLKIAVTPEGVHVSGEIPTPLMHMSFESVWAVSAAGGRVEARLAGLTAGGLPAGPLRMLVMHALQDMIKEPGVTVVDDAVVFDVKEIIRKQELPVGLDFEVRSVECVQGGIKAEGGWPPK